MYRVDKKKAYVDDDVCHYELGMYILEDGDTQLCVTRQQCVARNRFVFDDSGLKKYYECITGSECAQEETCYDGDDSPRPCYYAYSATGTCIKAEPYDINGFDTE